MTNLKQLAEDSFNSAFRRFPNSSSDDVIQKIYEEVHELEDAYLEEADGGKLVSNHCPELSDKEEEVADVILSCLMFAKLENIDIEKALKIKNEFNKTRK
jgi:NTP pyrophosphatase (non-canonical NTP hydrolase)